MQNNFQTVAKPNEMVPRYAYGALPEKAGNQFVIISQTCDIARGSNIEPFVAAARAQKIKEGPRLAEARGSVRFYLLNEQTGLVVDLCYVVQIEKPLLLSFGTPVFGPPNQEVARDFRYWLGNRYSRPAYPDGFSNAISKPLKSRLQALLAEGNPLADVRKHIREVRTVMPPDSKPYPVDLVVLLDPTEIEVEEKAMKTGAIALFGELFKSLDRGDVAEPTVIAVLANEWPVSEYWATEPIDLDLDGGDS